METETVAGVLVGDWVHLRWLAFHTTYEISLNSPRTYMILHPLEWSIWDISSSPSSSSSEPREKFAHMASSWCLPRGIYWNFSFSFWIGFWLFSFGGGLMKREDVLGLQYWHAWSWGCNSSWLRIVQVSWPCLDFRCRKLCWDECESANF